MLNTFTCYVVGDDSLLIKCSQILLERGHQIYGVVSSNPPIENWATRNDITTLKLNDDLINHLNSKPYDYLFSIANLSILPDEIINSPRKCAINFHDGPLPKYAGLNATSWAIVNQEKLHGITWHEIRSEVDKGNILKQVVFETSQNETSLSLNAKCYESGFLSFRDLIDELANDTIKPIQQDPGERTYFGKYRRPEQAAIINWNRGAEEISALIRALDFGRYPNPLGLPKVKAGGEYFIIRELSVTDIPSTDSPGEITSIDDQHIRVATETNDVEFAKGLSIDGVPLSIAGLIHRYSLKKGFKFEEMDGESAEEITQLNSSVAEKEAHWVKQLSILEFVDVHYAKNNIDTGKASNFKSERIHLSKEVLRFFLKIDPTPQISLASAFGIFVGRHCGKNDFNIGYSDADLMRGVGKHNNLFSEYVPLRVAFDSETHFTNAIGSLSVAFEKSAENKTYVRDVWGRYPVLYQNNEDAGQFVSPINIVFSENLEAYEAQHGSIITLVISKNLESCCFNFDSSAITEEGINLLKAQFTNFLEEAAANSEQEVAKLSILSAYEKSRLFEEWNNTRIDFPESKCIHQLFEEQAEITPEGTAVVYNGKSLSYRELDDRSNQVACRLQKLGVKPDTLVGVCQHRSLDMVVSLLGILKAGGAYVPLDSSFPKNRLSYMIEDSKCSVILTETGLIDVLGSVHANIIAVDKAWDDNSGEGSGNLKCAVTSDNLAYVIYTSGSTGKPKGVMIEHRNVVNLFVGMDTCIKPDSGSTWLAVTTLSFDISVIEILWTLARGFKVVIYSRNGNGLNVLPEASNGRQETESNSDSIPQLIKLHNVTHFQCTPSMASMLLLDEEAGSAFSRLKKFLIGGEAFPARLAAQLQKVVGGEIINMYGPTETTVWSTTYKLNGDQQSIPIGRPIANTQIYILDANLQPVPIGVPGELMIGGAGVVRGYFNKPELTAERFIENPFSNDPGSRIYHTGDLARYLPDGNIEFLGRMDHQIKIRGYRIELGEIEAVLNNHPAVYESVVIAREDVPDQKRLVAYVVPHKEENLKASELRNYAKEKLPGYMVPSHVVTLDAFPQTPNKKIDRKALPAPENSRLERGTDFDPPRTDIEEAVAEIWAEALDIQQIGRDDNFFGIGGDSLAACGIILGIQRTCYVDLPLQTIFHAPTVATLAKALEKVFMRQVESERTNVDSYRDHRDIQPHSNAKKVMKLQNQKWTDPEERNELTFSPTVKKLAAIWSKILRVEHVRCNDNFFHLGGKSIDAVSLFAEIEQKFGMRLPFSSLLQAPTVELLANIIDEGAQASTWSSLVPIRSEGTKPPLFLIHGAEGNVLFYRNLARYLGKNQPLYGLQSLGLDGNGSQITTLEEMASHYIREIKSLQPKGPYFLGGYCLGGTIALEMARQLKALGDQVALVAMIETYNVRFFNRALSKLLSPLHLLQNVLFHLQNFLSIRSSDKWRFFNDKWKVEKGRLDIRLAKLPNTFKQLWRSKGHQRNKKLNIKAVNEKATYDYEPKAYSGHVVSFQPKIHFLGQNDPQFGWGDIVRDSLCVNQIPIYPKAMLVEPFVQTLAQELKAFLDEEHKQGELDKI